MIVVYNPKSGKGLDKRKLREQFEKNGLEVSLIVPISELSRLRNLKKDDVVAAIGGDGTISAVAGYIVDAQAILAPLPGGTLNHFTKDIGIPQDLNEALGALRHAKPRILDVASVNGSIFINNSSLGMYPTSLRTREQYEGRLGKWPAALIASVRAFVRFRVFTVSIDNEVFKTPFIFVGNNNYKLDGIGGPVRGRIDEGILSVFIAKTASRWVLLRVALWAAVGRAKRLDEFEVRTLKKMTVQTKRGRLHVSYDGEVAEMKTPLVYEVHAKALRVLY